MEQPPSLRNLYVRTGASLEFQCSSRATSIFFCIMSPAEQPALGAGRNDGRTCAGGMDAAAETPWPQLHSAPLRDSGNSLFVRPASGLPEEKQHFHLSVSTEPFIYVQAPGRGAGSHNPSGVGRCRVKKVGGQGPPQSLPSRAPQGNGAERNYTVSAFSHSFHKYFHAKHLKGLGSERGDTAPPSKEPTGL